MNYIKLYSNEDEREEYYEYIGKIVDRLVSTSVLPDRFEVLRTLENAMVVSDTKTDIQLFIKKKEDSQYLDILKRITNYMIDSNHWVFIYTLGLNKANGTVIYDYYTNNLYDFLTEMNIKGHHCFVINIVIRVLFGIYFLNKLNILHMDLHLRNILYNENEMNVPLSFKTGRGKYELSGPESAGYEIVIGDFGLATRMDDRQLGDELALFYKSFFPLFYFSNPSINFSSVGYKYIDIWRFLKTFLNVINGFPYYELRPAIHFMTRAANVAEKRLVSEDYNDEFPDFCLDLIEILQLELIRLS